MVSLVFCSTLDLYACLILGQANIETRSKYIYKNKNEEKFQKSHLIYEKL